MIEIEDLIFKRGNQKILDQLNLNIEKKSIYGLLGANGSGKTTLLNLIINILDYDEGKIYLDKHLVSRFTRNTFLSKVGVLFDKTGVYDFLSAFENVEQRRRLMHNLTKVETERVLSIVGLEAVKYKKVKTFSYGMRQRLGIAMALLGNPPLIIMDEPTNGLDPQALAELRKLILQLNQENEVTFLISTHALGEIEKIATHIGILKSGKVVVEKDLKETKIEDLEKLYIESTHEAGPAQ